MPSDSTRIDHPRRRLLSSIGVLGGLGLTGCLGNEEDSDDSAPKDDTDEDPEDDSGEDSDDSDGHLDDDTGEDLAPAVFEVSELDPSEVETETGAPFAVSASITNAGEAEGTQGVEVRIEGESFASQSLTLEGGDADRIAFESVEIDGIGQGEYTFSVATEDGEVAGTLVVTGEPDEEPVQAGLLHHWPMREGVGDTIADVVGGEDGTIEGVDWVRGDWTDGSALRNASSGSVELTELGAFGEDLNQDFAIAYTIESDDGSSNSGVFSSRLPHGQFVGITIGYNNSFFGLSKSVLMTLHDGEGESAVETAENGLLDGGLHRVVINKITNDAANWEIHIDGEAVASQIATDHQGDEHNELEEMPPLQTPVRLFEDILKNGRYLEGTLDDVSIYGEALKGDAVTEDYERQPWS